MLSPRLPEEPRGRRGHAGPAPGRRLPAGRGREAGGRDRREHLRLHRPGEAGVGRRHPRDGAREGGGPGEAAGGHRLPHPALRRGPAPGDPGDRRHPRDRPGGGDRAGGRRGSHLADGGGAGPAHLGLRPHRAARPLDAAVARLREDQRGVRLHLLLLHHPEPAGPAPQPRGRGHRGGGRSARGPGRARDRPGGAGLDALRPRPRGARRARLPAAPPRPGGRACAGSA